ncbi:MAG TPA: Fur family transcriptional regulator [Solirubrobacterales bacterium]|nr:Fur family transcriptional regulator [Solirubrobacterales bacterium]
MAARAGEVDSPPAEHWVKFAEGELRAAGYRASAPRAAVIELIGRQDCVLTAQEIADELRRRRRAVGIATVYRTLELLDRLKLVQRLDIGGGSTRYEPALPGGEHHHHHLVCERCGRVTPFEDPELERAIAALARRLDHRVGEHDVVLSGSCPDCVDATRD